MPDKDVAWAITEIEAAMANAVRQRKYYAAVVNDPRNKDAEIYVTFAEHKRQKWAGKVYGLEAARRILEQVDG